MQKDYDDGDYISVVLTYESMLDDKESITISSKMTDLYTKSKEAFLSNADAGNYFEPNRVIPTKERSKWRFAVMRFLKQLEAVPADSEYAEAAAKLYLEMYR